MTEDLWTAIEADADAFDELTTESGSELSALIRQVSSVKTELFSLEEKLKLLKQKRDRYLFDLIPAKMHETGLDEVKVDGNKVSLQAFVSGTMPKDRCSAILPYPISEKSEPLISSRIKSAFLSQCQRTIAPKRCKLTLRKRVLIPLRKRGSSLAH